MQLEMDNIGLKIGMRIYNRRKQLGMTQETLAERIGINPKHISLIEKGSNMRLDTLIKMGQILDLDYTFMITGNNTNSTIPEIQNLFSKLDENKFHALLEILRALASD